MADFVLVFCNRGFKEEVLFILKDRPDFQKGRVNLPGGKIESFDADPLSAAVRELQEETGYTLHNGKVVGLITETTQRFNVYICSGFVAEKHEPLPQPGETEQPFWRVWSQMLKDPRLMLNLKVVVPLLMAGIKDFEIIWDDRTDMFAPSFDINLRLKNEVLNTAPVSA